jgi:hypothetical protein
VQLLCNTKGSEVRESCKSFSENQSASLDAGYSYESGGEGGIRTPGRGFGPYNGLANG